MKEINDLQIGKAGEYLVCADLILKGLIAFPSEQGLPFDVVIEYKNKLLKVQVKTTRGAKHIAQRKTKIPAYTFHIGTNGKMNRRKNYSSEQVDIFALVALDAKAIAYIQHIKVKSTMNFRVDSLKGSYHDEQSVKIKETVMGYKKAGYSAQYTADCLKMKLSNVYKYYANVSIKQKGTNAGVYFSDFTLENCLNGI